MTAIVAGTKFRGQFEERIKNVIKELEDHHSTGHPAHHFSRNRHYSKKMME